MTPDGKVNQPKTARGERSFFLPRLALQQIRRYQQKHDEACIYSSYLFCAEDGARISVPRLRYCWEQWTASVGIKLTLHELRHTFISYTRQRTDLSLDDLKPIYGHSDSMNTDAVYNHPVLLTAKERAKIEEHERAMSRAISEAFSKLIS